MKKFKNPLIFALVLLPVALVGGLFTTIYQFDLLDPAVIAEMVAQVGSREMVMVITVAQTVVYTLLAGFFGYIVSEKVGLMKVIRFEKTPLLRVVLISVVCGILFSLDYWTFGKVVPEIAAGTTASMTVPAVIASVLYGGIVEEVLLRLLVMSLLTLVIWKLFFRKQDTAPAGAAIAANIVAAVVFAVGHLPATYGAFGQLTALILFRCILFNGGLGLLFGWLYRKYGIQYAMIGHALVHIVSKVIWFIFI